MDQPDEAKPQPTRRKSADRRVKLGFLLVVLVAVAVVAYFQLSGPSMPDEWGDDLDAALAAAAGADPPRKVLVFVGSFPVGTVEKDLIRTTLSKKQNIAVRRDFERVRLTLDRDAGWARRYGVTRAPTMLVLSADGARFAKREGFIGEADFPAFLESPLKEARATAPAAGG